MELHQFGMMKKIIAWIVFVLLIVAAVLYYWFFNPVFDKNNAWQYIPDEAGLVIQIDNPRRFISKFGKDSKIRNSLFKNEKLKKLINGIETTDSLFSSHAKLSKLFNSPFLIPAIYDAAENRVQWLFIVQPATEMNTGTLKSHLEKYLKVNYTGKNREFLAIRYDSLSPDIYLTVKDNLIFFSTDIELVKKTISTAQMAKSHFSEDKSFVHLQKISGKKVDARLYLQYSRFSQLFKPWLSMEGEKAFQWIGNLAKWGETDVIIKKDELMMNGFSYAVPGNYLAGFFSPNQENIRAFGILPFNTNFLIVLEVDDLKNAVNEKKLKSFNPSLQTQITRLLEVSGPEMALASNAYNRISVKPASWFFLKTGNPGKAKQILDKISSISGTTGEENYNGHAIKNAGVKNLIPGLFGTAFKNIEYSWYTLLDDFIVFGNSSGSLKKLIRLYESGKTLDMNENFTQFSDNIWDASDLLFYLRPKSIQAAMANYLNKKALGIMKKNESLSGELQGASFQFSTSDTLFYTSFYFRFNESLKEENLALWKVQLDDEIAGKPWLVKDHKTKKYNIIVFDVRSNMYLVSPDGMVLWKKRIDALLLSRIYQVDYYKNGKIQYLFNTKDFIYLIDKNGNPVTGYPKKLNPYATNGISVFDYNGKKDYRVLIALADKKIHNYQLNGKPVKGWKNPRMKQVVTEPVTRLVSGGKDYIIITDREDNIRIVNRRGETRIHLKENPGKAKNSGYYINRTNNKGIIITTDKNGRLVYISKNGNVRKTELGKFSPDHFFLYQDFNGNGDKDFIFVDGNTLVVINRFKDVLFTYQFPSAITIKPVFFRLGKHQNVLGVVSSKENTVFLFDKKGNTLIGSGLVGENPFTVGSLNNDGVINLVTSSDNTLFNYKID